MTSTLSQSRQRGDGDGALHFSSRPRSLSYVLYKLGCVHVFIWLFQTAGNADFNCFWLI